MHPGPVGMEETEENELDPPPEQVSVICAVLLVTVERVEAVTSEASEKVLPQAPVGCARN